MHPSAVAQRRSVDPMKVGGCGPAQPGAFVDPSWAAKRAMSCILLLLLGGDLLIRSSWRMRSCSTWSVG